jgi:hypothetical protein
MMSKRFLVPVLALAAFGLPGKANPVVDVYCDNGCSNSTSAFDSLIFTTPYTYAYGVDQTFTGTLVSSTEYLDSSGVEFMDTRATNTFSITGSDGLATSSTNGIILITVPAAYAAIQLSLSAAAGMSNFTCIDLACDGTQLSTTPIFVDYINTTPGTSWTIQISTSTPESIIVDGFNPASLGSSQPASTPEVGTLLLIGSGLIAMRWLKRVPRRFFRTPQTA